MKNKFFKIILTALVLTFGISLTAVFASADTASPYSAEDEGVTEEFAGASVADSAPVCADCDSAVGEEGKTENGTAFTAGAPVEEKAEKSAEDASFWESLYNGVKEHLGEIFCALSLAGSVFLAFAYKKGLLPIVTGAIGAIGAKVGKLGEDTASFVSHAEKENEKISGILNEASGALTSFSEALLRIEGELSALKTNGEKIERTEHTLNEQIEMLYELFMSSALPQYQKDAVAKRIADMRKRTDDSEG